MKHKLHLIILCTFFFFTTQVNAQTEEKKDTIWTTSGLAGIKFTQVNFSNWASGGNNAISFDFQGNYEANYKKDKHIWNNRMELSYGLNKNKSEGMRKTNDKIYLNTNYGYSIYNNLYLSALLNFQTQFSPGYDYDLNPDVSISDFMSPAYLIVGAGLTWIPNKYLTVTFSPVAYRGTFVLNERLSNEGAYGVTPGDKVFSEFGGNMKIEGKYEFLKNMTAYSRLDLYSAYTHNPQNVDVNWEVQINMAINKWFSTYITTNLVYDDDVKILQEDGSKGARVQFKEVFGIGLQINF